MNVYKQIKQILFKANTLPVIYPDRKERGCCTHHVKFPYRCWMKNWWDKVNHLRKKTTLNLCLHWIFLNLGFKKTIYCWKYANNLNLNQAKCNFPEFLRWNEGVSRTLRKTASFKQNHFGQNTFFDFIANNLSP